MRVRPVLLPSWEGLGVGWVRLFLFTVAADFLEGAFKGFDVADGLVDGGDQFLEETLLELAALGVVPITLGLLPLRAEVFPSAPALPVHVPGQKQDEEDQAGNSNQPKLEQPRDERRGFNSR